ncbi:MAG: M20/M25/M40 family metallo-hydrolase, partial [Verrucomicrobiae bacterium]|nr:M20/M25/M40 family metallo-hydrolase [Verrucomicrobiae bacterium]
QHARSLGLHVERDCVGNTMVCPPGRRERSPLVLVAHMDHPGFEAESANRARVLGGIPIELLRPGARVRFYSRTGVVHAVIRRRLRREKIVELACKAGLHRGDPGVWDLPVFRRRGKRIYATAIDGVLGVVAVLAALGALARHRVRAPVWGLFTRAEEVGFAGAIEVAQSGCIPPQALVVSLEASSERPWARVGNGPIIRVGDRMTTFDPAATWFLMEVARRKQIHVQRCLMDGGTCEATAFAAYGYRVAGLCVPLGNYHNVGKRLRPAAEFVSVRDLVGLVRLSVETALQWPRFSQLLAAFPERVRRIYRSAPRKLNDA